MYKTVRHGENSLQYTILPQTEEILNNSGLKGRGRDCSPSVIMRRNTERTVIKYGFFIVFSMMLVVMLVAIPLCLMDGAIRSRRTISYFHHDPDMIAGPLSPTARELVKSRKKELNVLPEIITTVDSKAETMMISTETTSTGTTALTTQILEKVTTPWTKLTDIKSWIKPAVTTKITAVNSGEKDPVMSTSAGHVRLLDNYMSLKPWDRDVIIRPSVTPDPIPFKHIFRNNVRTTTTTTTTEKPTTAAPKVFDDVLITTKALPSTTTQPATTEYLLLTEKSKLDDLKDTILSVDDDDDFKESLEVDEVFSLPPSRPGWGAGREPDEVIITKPKRRWYGARYPFETSTYFWTGAAPSDSLLPPLLMAALTSGTLVLLLAAAVRCRKRHHAASAHIGELTADFESDDNTNLLEDPETPEEPKE